MKNQLFEKSWFSFICELFDPLGSVETDLVHCSFHKSIDDELTGTEKESRINTEGDSMSCIKTYTGVMFDPLHPESELIDILDIAHALSMLCRANGHFRSFYSVGQHCINCALEAKERGYSERVQLACLLHDASEAYLSDVTRPVKQEMPKYLEIEKPLQEAIWQKYLGAVLTEEENKLVFGIDDAMLYHEFVALMDTRLSPEEPELRSKPAFSFLGFENTEKTFLRLYTGLLENSEIPGNDRKQER